MFHNLDNIVRLALRSLVRNRRRSSITLGAIFLGVAFVIFGNGFGSGLVNMMVFQSINGRLGAIQVHRAGYLQANEAAPLKLDLPESGELLDKITSTPGVSHVSRRIRFGGLVSNGARASMIMGMALEPENEFKVCPERPNEVPAANGKHLTPGNDSGGVLGLEMAKGYNSKVGDSLTVTAAGKEGGINAMDLAVLGITQGAPPMESKRVLAVPLKYAQKLLQMDGRVTEYAVRVDDLKLIDDVAVALRERLGPDYEVSTWAEVMPFLRDMVNRLHLVLTGISLVLFIIVIFGVINTMLMSVYERVREIGTMMAVGVKRWQVLALILLEAAVLGLLGGSLGAVVGWTVTKWLNVRGLQITPPGSAFLQLVRPEADPTWAVAAVLVATLGALLAAAYPARKASLLNPVDALRTL